MREASVALGSFGCRVALWAGALLLAMACSGNGNSKGADDVQDPGDLDTGVHDSLDREDELAFVDSRVPADLGVDEEAFILPDITDPGIPFPVLSEIGCHNDDFIEVYNRSPEAEADLSDFVLRDIADPTHRYVFPEGTILGPGAWLVVPTEDTMAYGLTFGLRCGDDVVELLDADGAVLDRISLPMLADGVTWGRLPDGIGDWEVNEPTAGFANKADPSAALFVTEEIGSISITVPQSSIDALAVEPREYAPADFSIDWEGSSDSMAGIGVHLKGGTGSYQEFDEKPAWKVKFNFADKANRFRGLKKVSLNNMVQDPTMIHEVLSYRLFAAMGVPAPRVGYANLTVNGLDYGVYLVLENYDDISLPQWFFSTQHLYEQGTGSEVMAGLESTYEVDEGDETDLSDLTILLFTASTTDDESWFAAMSSTMDFPQLYRMWAVEQYIGHFDGYASTHDNFFLHSDNDGYFTMMPYGTDQSFVKFTDWHAGDGYLFTRCMDIPDCLDGYHAALTDLSGVVEALDLPAMALQLKTTLADKLAADPRAPYSSEDVAAGYETVMTNLESRRLDLESFLSCLSLQGGDCSDPARSK